MAATPLISATFPIFMPSILCEILGANQRAARVAGGRYRTDDRIVTVM